MTLQYSLSEHGSILTISRDAFIVSEISKKKISMLRASPYPIALRMVRKDIVRKFGADSIECTCLFDSLEYLNSPDLPKSHILIIGQIIKQTPSPYYHYESGHALRSETERYFMTPGFKNQVKSLVGDLSKMIISFKSDQQRVLEFSQRCERRDREAIESLKRGETVIVDSREVSSVEEYERDFSFGPVSNSF